MAVTSTTCDSFDVNSRSSRGGKRQWIQWLGPYNRPLSLLLLTVKVFGLWRHSECRFWEDGSVSHCWDNWCFCLSPKGHVMKSQASTHKLVRTFTNLLYIKHHNHQLSHQNSYPDPQTRSFGKKLNSNSKKRWERARPCNVIHPRTHHIQNYNISTAQVKPYRPAYFDIRYPFHLFEFFFSFPVKCHSVNHPFY